MRCAVGTAPRRPATSFTSHRRVSSIRRCHRPRDRSVLGLPAEKERTRTLGNYAIGHVLGEGSFGKVRIGTHIVTGEKVAIKILEKSRIVETTDIQRVAREIKILKRNRHRNIIQLFEVLDAPNAIYLIMESADGGEMFNYIVKHRRVDEVQACCFFSQLVDGADYLHSMEVTHRDLKPENLLLQTAKEHGYVVKIVDFGLSNTHDGGRLLQTACGSPCYAAPEMIAGKRYHGPKADIWSMGIILYALVCGYLPFEHECTSVLYKKIMSGSYSTPKWISKDVKDLMSGILNTNPDVRYSITEIRRHPWYTLIEMPVVSASVCLPTSTGTPNSAGMKPIPKNILLDKRILLHMEQLLKLSPQVVANHLASGAHNNITTTYHLLSRKLFRVTDSDVAESFELAMAVSEDYMRYQRRSGAVVNTQENQSGDGTRSKPIAPVQTSRVTPSAVVRPMSIAPSSNEGRPLNTVGQATREEKVSLTARHQQRSSGHPSFKSQTSRPGLMRSPPSISLMQMIAGEAEADPPRNLVTSFKRPQPGAGAAGIELTPGQQASPFRQNLVDISGCVGRTELSFGHVRPAASRAHSARRASGGLLTLRPRIITQGLDCTKRDRLQ
mmetsp:Transcript_22749/g.73166  ORF Transcript_22749/g.73166 Transcript_22749/m.73166 type:complete len:612 (-) Transcript_22749:523-2358(-)